MAPEDGDRSQAGGREETKTKRSTRKESCKQKILRASWLPVRKLHSFNVMHFCPTEYGDSFTLSVCFFSFFVQCEESH